MKATSLDDLAVEVLLLIMKHLPDLITLDVLLRASPLTSSTFNLHAVEITDSVFASGHLHGHIRVCIRVAALIRSSDLPINNLKDFLWKTTYSAMDSRICSLRKNLSPTEFRRDTPTHVLRGLLASHRHLTKLSLRFLDIHLRRFSQLRPKQIANTESFPAQAETCRNQEGEYPSGISVRQGGKNNSGL